MTGLLNTFFDPTFLVTLFVGIFAFATIATLVLPLMERGGLDDRLKSVSKRREELRARHHAQLSARRGSLRVEPSTLMKSVLDKFKLGTSLESENSREKLAQAIRQAARLAAPQLIRVAERARLGRRRVQICARLGEQLRLIPIEDIYCFTAARNT